MMTPPLRIASVPLPRPLTVLLLVLIVGLTVSLPAAAQSDGTFAGQVAYIGSDGNVYTLDAVDADPVPLTDDARRGVRGYQWPTWSTDGRLAFFGQEVTQREGEASLLLKVFVAPPGSTQPALAHESTTDTLTYAYWSPGNCPDSTACRDLAVLTTMSGNLRVLRIRDEAPAFTVEPMGLGGPFYYSYSPDGSQMIWQRFGRQIDVYDAFAGEITESLPDDVGLFQAPMWSPVDDRLLFSAFDEEGVHNLVVAEGDDRQIVAADQEGPLAFAWSPDGQHIAYKSDFDAVHIVDATSGAEVVHSNTGRVVAFFWSPDGQKLAYLALPSANDSPQVYAPGAAGHLAAPARQQATALFWHIIDLTTSQQWTYFRGFVPTRSMVYYLSFFDQFAQSHRVWSPDSRHLVFAELAEDGPVISLLDTTQPTQPTDPIAAGAIGIWSFQ